MDAHDAVPAQKQAAAQDSRDVTSSPPAVEAPNESAGEKDIDSDNAAAAASVSALTTASDVLAAVGAQSSPVVRWEVHPSPYGTPYYYNAASGESRWDLPSGPLDVVVAPHAECGSSAPVSSVTLASDASSPTGELCKSYVDDQDPSPPQKSRRLGEERSDAGDVSIAVEHRAFGSGDSSSSDSSSSSSEDEQQTQELGALRGVAAKLQAFTELLKEKGIGRFATYESWRPRLLVDPRFTAVPADMRKQLFAREVQRLGDVQDKAKAQARKSGRQRFHEFMNEAKASGLMPVEHCVQEVLSAIANSDLRSDPRWTSCHPAQREKFVVAIIREERDIRDRDEKDACREFRNLLQDKFGAAICEGDFFPWKDACKQLRNDIRFGRLDSSLRQQLYAQFVSDAQKRHLLALRQNKSEKDEVAEQRQRSRRANSEAEYLSLLRQHIRSPLEVSWSEVLVLLGGTMVHTDLDEASREGVFNSWVRAESQQRIAAFEHALQQLPLHEVGPELSFEQVRDVAVTKVAGGEAKFRGLDAVQLKRCWEDWRRARLEEATDDFRKWLQQLGDFSEIVDDPLAQDGHGPNFERLCAMLSDDARYKRLEAVPSRRRQLLVERMRESVDRAMARRQQRSDTDVDE